MDSSWQYLTYGVNLPQVGLEKSQDFFGLDLASTMNLNWSKSIYHSKWDCPQVRLGIAETELNSSSPALTMYLYLTMNVHHTPRKRIKDINLQN